MGIDRNALLNAANILLFFIKDNHAGDSYWTDFEGNEHSTDMASACDFLRDLQKYLSNRKNELAVDIHSNRKPEWDPSEYAVAEYEDIRGEKHYLRPNY